MQGDEGNLVTKQKGVLQRSASIAVTGRQRMVELGVLR